MYEIRITIAGSSTAVKAIVEFLTKTLDSLCELLDARLLIVAYRETEKVEKE